MPLLIKLLIDSGCGILNALGGFHFLWMRRYMMPIIIGLSNAYICHTWWLMFLTWPAIGTLSIGYSKDGNFGRALWIGLQCFILGLGLVILNHLSVFLYIPYIILGCVLGGLYRNWWQPLGDFITGTYFYSIVFFIH